MSEKFTCAKCGEEKTETLEPLVMVAHDKGLKRQLWHLCEGCASPLLGLLAKVKPTMGGPEDPPPPPVRVAKPAKRKRAQ